MGRFDEAARVATSLSRQYGFAPEEARRTAALATAGGLSVEQAGMLSVAMAQGGQVSTPEQAAALFRGMGPDVAAGLRADPDKLATTPSYELRKRVGQMPGAQPVGAHLATVEELFEAMGDFGVLPAGVETIADLRQRLEEARQVLSKPAEEYVSGMWEGLWRGITGGRRGVMLPHERERAEAQRLLSLLGQAPSGAAPAEIAFPRADDQGAE